MDFEVSDRREHVSCQHFESDDDDDDDGIPLSQMFPNAVGLVKCDGSVKKRDSMFDNPDSSLHVSVKKSKLSPYHHHAQDEDDLRQVIDKDRERKEEELKALSQKIAEITVEFMAKEIELDAANNLIGELEEKLESEKKKLLQVISMKKRFEGRVEELESKEKHLEGRVKELESRKKQLEGHMEEFDPKEKKELVNELESEKKHIESGLQELEFKEKQFEGQKKEFHSKEEEFKGRVKEFKSEKKQFESQVEHFKSKEKQFERRWKELELKENKFIIQVKEFELKEKQFGRQVNGLESKLNKLDRKSVV